MIEVSNEAKNKIQEILEKNPGKYLRLVMDGTGCGGPYLELSLDEADYGEKPIQVNGVDFLMSEDARKYAEATRIDIFVNPALLDSLSVKRRIY